MTSSLLALFAVPSFPRGPGLYLNLFALIPAFLCYLVWLRTCCWVSGDARRLKQEVRLWNSLTLGGGLLGLLYLWLVPWFGMAVLMLLGFCFLPQVAYLWIRNPQVPVRKRVGTRRHLRRLLRHYFRMPLDTKPGEDDAGPEIRFPTKTDDDKKHLRGIKTLPGYRQGLVLLQGAVQSRASHLVLEPAQDTTAVRCRIDGIAHPRPQVPRGHGEAVLQVFKSLASLDVNEKRKPQEGRFLADVDGQRMDFSATTSGSLAGEKLVLQITDRSQRITKLGQLGVTDSQRQKLSTIANQSRGLFVVCGPADSGKTTTVYACLNEMDRFQRTVVTIENPLLYRLPNSEQHRLDIAEGETYGSKLKSLLRQDADVVLVGDIPDEETADQICRAPQEGVLVFATLEAPDAVTGLFRLLELKAPVNKLANVLHGVLAQRLVRVLCSECRVRYRPDPEVLRKLNLPAERIKHFYRPPEENERKRDETGKPALCESCGGIGYRGRIGVFELLPVNESIRKLLRENTPASAVKQEAVRMGMIPLQDEVLRLLLAGTTSVAEVLRVK